MNVRICSGASGLITRRRAKRLQIHGFFQSRDYIKTLADILEKAKKRSGVEITVDAKDHKLDQVSIDRNSIEVVPAA